ncbi:glycosyltransferase family 4 protein [Amycolatopsis samaneae]|uniref:Glycosyltransferase family 4 protein n=1 Tax=Amycolatopsis samaneae TaxID=664691 RepID=A0ABW5GP89_9PSEU
MRVLIVSWEYPPVLVGGLGRHVHALARQLAGQGEDVTVLCREPAGSDVSTHAGADSVVDGVRIVRVPEDPPHLSFDQDLVAWALAVGHAMIRAGHKLLETWTPDVVHAHDWLVAHPAIALADAAHVPLVTTMHATEAGRHGGALPERLNRQVHSIEWWLANRADTLITCSRAMRAEVTELFDLDPAGISVVHNGIDPADWQNAIDRTVPSRRRNAPGGGPTLLYFGRLEWEKGVQDLIAAFPEVRRRHLGSRLIVAGHGRKRDWLAELAREHGVAPSVQFTGHLVERELAAALSAADLVVLPSRYEPFGIAALEAAAADIPIVAAEVGGLSEVVRHGRTGTCFRPGDVPGLTAAICSVLAHPAEARRRARAARARLATEFDWSVIAAQTTVLYRRAVRGLARPLPRPKIPAGQLLMR